jgi:CP family cyanate transporter-like MFS transporter
VLAAPAGRSIVKGVASRWWPSWRESQAVRIGLVMGMASAVYFGSNAYIPDFLDQTGRHDLISPTLLALNGAQLLTAPTVAIWQRLLTGKVGFIGSSVVMAIAQLGIILTPGVGVVIWAFMLGFAAALSFIVVLTLPPRLAAAGDVHRMSAAIFTVQYAVAFVLPVIAGALWDATGLAVLAFAPGVAATAAMAWLVLPLRVPSD